MVTQIKELHTGSKGFCMNKRLIVSEKIYCDLSCLFISTQIILQSL